ncbi:GDSL-type esterase/lipase family protein [Shimia sp. CNT1-13L.2]|uniref:GDSL-type esterase/lipase family protein n=1 Tax=Shimia sp. CNT1-13L.2 TaxID=2959663 RepID=UPI0020CC1D7A|nr:GDSL-type esterase/lipase family protein [Shimia sp. CNT1-13L.2]MCP9483639.1 GDSL-type esterase/lipase family protein [Shimia sp. CNT1-13L.2]
MKTVLAFGDSLTWGSDPHTGGRHPRDCRWPVALAEGLDGVEVISEGLRGRATVYDRPSASSDMNGGRILPALLHSHAPLDLVIIMLGSNDLYEGFSVQNARDGLMRLVEIVRSHPYRLPEPHVPDVMLISPPLVSLGDDPFVTEAKVAETAKMAPVVAGLAEELGTGFFDAATVAQGSPADCYHLEAEDSRALGLALQAPVRSRLGL